MLIEIPPDTALLLPLFDTACPNHPMLFSTLLGHNPGRAFVDDPARPTQAVVRTADGLNFFSPGASQAFLDEGLEYSRQSGHVLIVWRSDGAAVSLPKADKIIARCEFPLFDASSPAYIQLTAAVLAEGFEFRPLDLDLLQGCEWKGEIEEYTGSLENFLAHGFGVCLQQQGEIVAEAYAPFVGQGTAEIGAVTREAGRGRGYASLTCARLIQTCLERGLAPYWSCDADNLASINLARKLGFQNQGEYTIQIYRGRPA